MALIGRACFNNKTLVNIMSYTGVYKIGKTNTNNNIRYYTHRFQMLKGGEYEYRYSKGGKTGYTDAAGNCLVSFAEKDGIRLVCSVMNSTASGRYTDSIALLIITLITTVNVILMIIICHLHLLGLMPLILPIR